MCSAVPSALELAHDPSRDWMSAASSVCAGAYAYGEAIGVEEDSVPWMQLDRGVDEGWISVRAQHEAVRSDVLDGSIGP